MTTITCQLNLDAPEHWSKERVQQLADDLDTAIEEAARKLVDDHEADDLAYPYGMGASIEWSE